MTYFQWNDALARWIFSVVRADAPVFIYMERDAIEWAGRKVAPDANFDGFIAALRTGADWDKSRKGGICERALNAIRGSWRERTRDGETLKWPPYLAYLVLFTHAAGLNGEFSTSAYYARLRTCLGEGDANGTYPGFGEMEWLWEDLEKWSNVDKRGELGRFQYFLYGSHRYVGAPQAQTLLLREDRALLPWVFERCEFDPSSPPRETELLSAFLEQGKNHLGVRTRKILEGAASKSAAPAREVLAAIITNELRAWDGRVPQRFDEDERQTRELAAGGERVARDTMGSLRLCATLDAVTGTFKAHLRCKTPVEFPDDGFWLSSTGKRNGGQWIAEEFDGSWSYPLQARATGAPLDMSSLDWAAGWGVADAEQGWKFRWRRAPVRLLTRDPEGILDDYIEVFRLPLGRPIWILVASDFADAVGAWGGKCARNWKRIEAKGLPPDWILFAATAVTEAAARLKTVPHAVLEAPSSTSLLFHGGVRVNRATRFFDFALPRVEIEGADDTILCWRELNKQDWLPVSCDADGFFSLPSAVADKEAIRLAAFKADGELKNGNELVAHTLYIEGAQGHWRAQVERETTSDAREMSAIAPLALGGLIAVEDDGTIIYLGRSPGQIARFPHRPDEWEPVWIVNGKRRRRAIYCGSALENETPLAATNAPRNDLREWKSEINPKVEAPREAELNQLWKKYLQIAR